MGGCYLQKHGENACIFTQISESPWRRLQVKPPTGAFFIALLGVEKTKDALFSEQEPEKMAEPVFG